MSLMEDIKTDQRTQILVAGMVLFALAFPAYFYYAAGQADSDFSVSGPVGNYAVDGTYSYHVIGEDTQRVSDGGTETIIVNSDAAGDEIDGLNIVGVRATLAFTDDEQGGGLGCLGYETADDQVGATLSYDPIIPTTNNSLISGGSISVVWFMPELVGETVVGMSESDIRLLLDGDGLGEGEHKLEISVNVVEGSGTGNCQTTDDGEDVIWKIELISLEYTLEMVEGEVEEEEEEPEE